MTLDLQEVARAMAAAGEAAALPVAGWSVDTRTQQPGDVYFALRGAIATATILCLRRWREARRPW